MSKCVIILTCVLAGSVLTGPAAAEPGALFPNVPTIVRNGRELPLRAVVWSADAADMDGDGLDELLISDSTTINIFDIVDGRAVMPPTALDCCPGGATNLRALDLDEDGDIDIIRGGRVWLNSAIEWVEGDVVPNEGRILIADFTGDGLADICGDDLYSGDGQGGFTLLASLGLTLDRCDGDFNGDGIGDLIDQSRRLVAMGNGTFDISPHGIPGLLSVVVCGDVNLDGFDDVIFQGSSPIGQTIQVALSTGEAFLTPIHIAPAFPGVEDPEDYELGLSLFSGVLTDLNGDDLPDLLLMSGVNFRPTLAQAFARGVVTLFNAGDGYFIREQGLASSVVSDGLSFDARRFVLANTNGDGLNDIFVIGSRVLFYDLGLPGGVQAFFEGAMLLETDGTGRWNLPEVAIAAPGPSSAFNSRSADLLTFPSSGQHVVLTARRTLLEAVRHDRGMTFESLPAIQPLLFDRERVVDIVVTSAAEGHLACLTSHGVIPVRLVYDDQWDLGALERLDDPTDLGDSDRTIDALRADGDGIADVVVAVQGEYDEPSQSIVEGGVFLQAGLADGTFAAPVNIDPALLSAEDLVTCDANGDGMDDIAVVASGPYDVKCDCFGPPELRIYLGSESGTFELSGNVSLPANVNDLAALDTDGDGREEIVVLLRDPASIEIIAWDGPAALAVRHSIERADLAEGVLSAADVYCDSTPELILSRTLSWYEPDAVWLDSRIDIYRFDVDGAPRLLDTVDLVRTVGEVFAEDLNEDGYMDLIVAGRILNEVITVPGLDPARCPGDANGDGAADFADLEILLASWGHTGSTCEPADFDHDGTVSFIDLNELLRAWNATCVTMSPR